MISDWQKKAIELLWRPAPWEATAFEEATGHTEIMTRTEIISRRFEAMRMKWPARAMELYQSEMLCLAWPKMAHIKSA